MADNATILGEGFRLGFWEFAGILRRRALWASFAAFVVVNAIVLSVVLRTDRYRAEARVLISDTAAQEAIDGRTIDANTAGRRLTNEINLALGSAVRVRLAEAAGVEVAEDRLIVSAESGSDLLVFSVESTTAEESALLTTDWTNAYIVEKRSQIVGSIETATSSLESDLARLAIERSELRRPINELEQQLLGADDTDRIRDIELELRIAEGSIAPQLSVLDSRIDALSTTLSELELSAQLAAAGSARILEPPTPPTDTTSAPLSILAVGGALLALSAGATAALIAERLDRRVTSRTQIERLGLSVLGSVPSLKSSDRSETALATMNNPDTSASDAYHRVRSSIQFAMATSDASTIMVTSPLAGEGKTSTAANLATAIAMGGNSVILADADLRRPRLRQIFGLEEVNGLSDCAVHGLDPSLILTEYPIENSADLFVLGAGRQLARPNDVLLSEGFEKTLAVLRGLADIVILDCPPVLPVADASILARQCDLAVIVIRKSVTHIDELRRTVEELNSFDARILGVVLIGDSSQDRYYSTYQ